MVSSLYDYSRLGLSFHFVMCCTHFVCCRIDTTATVILYFSLYNYTYIFYIINNYNLKQNNIELYKFLFCFWPSEYRKIPERSHISIRSAAPSIDFRSSLWLSEIPKEFRDPCGRDSFPETRWWSVVGCVGARMPLDLLRVRKRLTGVLRAMSNTIIDRIIKKMTINKN